MSIYGKAIVVLLGLACIAAVCPSPQGEGNLPALGFKCALHAHSVPPGSSNCEAECDDIDDCPEGEYSTAVKGKCCRCDLGDVDDCECDYDGTTGVPIYYYPCNYYNCYYFVTGVGMVPGGECCQGSPGSASWYESVTKVKGAACESGEPSGCW